MERRYRRSLPAVRNRRLLACGPVPFHRTPRLGPASNGRLVGRAIARVIAHEMYHFFTHTKRHSRSSALFRAALQPHDLVSEGVAFDAKEMEKLEQGIEHPADSED